jgi:diamine N-acetyltransferase
MKNISIIPVSIATIPKLSKIAKQTYSDHYPQIWRDAGAWYMQTMYNEAQLISELEDKNVLYYFVYQDNTLYGFIKLKIDYPLSIGKGGLTFGHGKGSDIAINNALYIDRIYFLKEATGKGLGAYCFDFITQLALSKGKHALWLMAMDTNDALFFYEKQGFSYCGTWTLDFDIMKEECRGMVIMYKKIMGR